MDNTTVQDSEDQAMDRTFVEDEETPMLEQDPAEEEAGLYLCMPGDVWVEVREEPEHVEGLAQEILSWTEMSDSEVKNVAMHLEMTHRDCAMWMETVNGIAELIDQNQGAFLVNLEVLRADMEELRAAKDSGQYEKFVVFSYSALGLFEELRCVLKRLVTMLPAQDEIAKARRLEAEEVSR